MNKLPTELGSRNISPLNTTLQFDNNSRVLVLAPHPDDESLASGGLLQIARAAGAAIRVLLVTDGDNNPWPQRWVEKRWKIGAELRKRWGERRRNEARAALAILGIREDEVRYFGIPDLGVTPLLLHADPLLPEVLRDQIAGFHPTLIIAPALSDRHPDHSALHVMLRLVLSGATTPRVLSYRVHGKSETARSVQISLDREQQQRKHKAISEHTSQLVLSHKRFLAYAATSEVFFDESIPTAYAPIVATFTPTELHVYLNLAPWRWRLNTCALYLVLESDKAGSLRWRVNVPRSSRTIDLYDMVQRCVIGKASVEISGHMAHVLVPLSNLGAMQQAYAKLELANKKWLVFDRAGWFALPCYQSAVSKSEVAR